MLATISILKLKHGPKIIPVGRLFEEISHHRWNNIRVFEIDKRTYYKFYK